MEGALKLKKKIEGQVDTNSKDNIKKLLVGKMASLQRRQTSSGADNQVFEDIGAKVWEESFANQTIHDVFDKLKNSNLDENVD